LTIPPANKSVQAVEKGGFTDKKKNKKKLKKRESVVILNVDFLKKKELCLDEGF
jgi:hypothetical protein